MSRLTAAIVELLDTADLAFTSSVSEDGLGFVLSMEGDRATFEVWIASYEDSERVVVASLYPALVPPALRDAAAEYLHRVNIGLILGGFDLDYESGAVRFRTGVDLESVTHLGPILKNTFYSNIISADRYFPGLAKVLEAGIAPRDAVALIRDAH